MFLRQPGKREEEAFGFGGLCWATDECGGGGGVVYILWLPLYYTSGVVDVAQSPSFFLSSPLSLARVLLSSRTISLSLLRSHCNNSPPPSPFLSPTRAATIEET